jgi:hypothetical protein
LSFFDPAAAGQLPDRRLDSQGNAAADFGSNVVPDDAALVAGIEKALAAKEPATRGQPQLGSATSCQWRSFDLPSKRTE